MQEARLYLQCN